MFIKAGEVQRDLICARFDLKFPDSGGEPTCDDIWLVKKLKRERKKLLREAIEAAILEQECIYGEGLEEAFKSHVEI